MTDSEILDRITQCLAGKKDAYAAIVRHFQQKILRLCYGYLGTLQDAEDAAMEVFVKVFRSLKSYDSAYAFSTWLYRIAVNHCIGMLRRQKRERNYLETVGANPENVTESNQPDTVFFSQSRQTALEQAIATLPVKYRTALTLKYTEDLSYQQIGQIMDIPVNTVGSLILRGKKELRQQLADVRGNKEMLP